MTLYRKPPARQTVNARDTTTKFKYPIAQITVKVVVMGFAGAFINGYRAGKIDQRKPTFLQESFDISIYRRDAQSLRFGLRGRQNLLRGKGPAGFFEGLPDGRSLARVSGILSGRHPSLMIARSR